MALPDPDVAITWGGKPIVDRAGATIGLCTQVFTDDATGLPEWATARMGTSSLLIPLVDAVEDAGRVRVAVSRDAVLLAPTVADQAHLSVAEEERLYRHYGIAVSEDRSPSLLPVDEGPPPQHPARTALSDRDQGSRRLLLLAGIAMGTFGVVAASAAWSRRRRRE